MKNTSLKLSNKLDKTQISFLSNLHNAIQEAGIPYFIVGAFARDLIMHYQFGIKTIRATLDTDIAIQIDNWSTLSSLKEILKNKLLFKEENEHRLVSKNNEILDIIPFGSIQNDEEISWPPDHEIKMNVLGFNEAYSFAIQLQINNDIYIPVCSLPGLVILKLVAWSDRDNQLKDADDIGFILKHYIEAGNEDLLNDQYNDLLGADNFDYNIASGRVLGRDIGKMLSDKTAIFIINLLDYEINQFENKKLVIALQRQYSYHENPIEYIRNILISLRAGIAEFKNV